MFSSCLGNTRERGSDLNNDESRRRGGVRGGAWRLRARSWFQGIWPFGRRETNLSQDSQGSQESRGNQGSQDYQESLGSQGSQGNQGIQDIQGSQEGNGNQGSLGSQGSLESQGSRGSQGSLGSQGNQGIHDSQGSQEGNGNQGGLGTPGSKDNEGNQDQDNTDQVGQESAPEVLNEFPRTPVYGPLEEMMSFLVMAIQGGDSFFALVFLYIQERLLTTQEVLDLLFTRYTSFCPDSEEDEQVKNTICSLLDYWIHKFPQDFCKIEHLPILTRVKNYLNVNMPYSDLLIRVHYMQEKLQSQVASDSGSSNEEASGDACISRTSVSNLRSGEPSIPTCSAPNLLTSNEDGYSADSSSLCTGAGEHTTSTTSCDKCAAGASCGNSYVCYITSV